ncbi:MAG TPA: 5'-3' exonuclease H3TH domain-containing protein [Methylomirabilota bacterium]|nr:5'-3' exonuclease H3TH domain-containing protein [Methylomirabilota bacterium]
MSVTPERTSSRLLLVDGHAFAYRAFHAIRELRAPDGSASNAIFGFIRMLEKMRALLAPTHLAVVWDGGLAADRLAEHPGYKADRPPMPESLERQIEEIILFLAASGIASLRQDGIEADDWLAGLARRARGEGAFVVIASSDKDFMQLVDERIGLFNPNDKSEKVWGPEEVLARTGVMPEQVVDWLSLVGDSVDSIPGVSGVGPKTAADLLRQFGSVEALLRRLDEVKPDRIRVAVKSAEAAVRRNQRLIQLRCITPGGFDLREMVAREPDYRALEQLFTRWGFRSLLAQVAGRAPAQGQLL